MTSLQLIYLLKLKTETHKFDLHVGEIKDIPFNYVVLAFFFTNIGIVKPNLTSSTQK